MINPKDFLTEVSKYTSLVSGVPDSALKGLSDYLDYQKIVQHIKVPNEGLSISYSAGYYMMKKKPSLWKHITKNPCAGTHNKYSSIVETENRLSWCGTS